MFLKKRLFLIENIIFHTILWHYRPHSLQSTEIHRGTRRLHSSLWRLSCRRLTYRTLPPWLVWCCGDRYPLIRFRHTSGLCGRPGNTAYRSGTRWSRLRHLRLWGLCTCPWKARHRLRSQHRLSRFQHVWETLLLKLMQLTWLPAPSGVLWIFSSWFLLYFKYQINFTAFFAWLVMPLMFHFHLTFFLQSHAWQQHL